MSDASISMISWSASVVGLPSTAAFLPRADGAEAAPPSSAAPKSKVSALARLPALPESRFIALSMSSSIRSSSVGARLARSFFRLSAMFAQCLSSTRPGQGGALPNSSRVLFPSPSSAAAGSRSRWRRDTSSRRIRRRSSSMVPLTLSRRTAAPWSPVMSLVSPYSFSFLRSTAAGVLLAALGASGSSRSPSSTVSSVASPSTPASRYVTTMGGYVASIALSSAPALRARELLNIMLRPEPVLIIWWLGPAPATRDEADVAFSSTYFFHRTCWTTRSLRLRSSILLATSSSRSSAESSICRN